MTATYEQSLERGGGAYVLARSLLESVLQVLVHDIVSLKEKRIRMDQKEYR